ncbi:MAG: tetratricopeptide repeat protein [Pontiella sp.]
MMLTKKTGRFTIFRQIFLTVSLFLGSTLAGYAQDAPTAGEMLQAALKAMQAKRYEDAIDSMYMYLGEVDESKAPRVLAISQDIRYKLGSILIAENRMDEAAPILQAYVDLPLANHPRQAMKMLTMCYFDTGAYEECVTAVTNALYYNENPVILSEKVTKSKDGDDEEDYSKVKIEPEADYTQEELTTLHMTLAESYFNIEGWAECIDPFTYVIEYTPNEQRKGYSIMQVINALIEIPDFDRITEWIPLLYRTEARFDIRVNLALMNAAAALYEAEEYDSALPLYRMILPRDELVAFQEGKMREIRISYGLPPEMNAQLTADEMLLFGVPDPTEAVVEEVEETPKEILELEQLIIALKGLPPYELDIQYRMADLYKTVDRFWESVKFFDMVFAVDPTSEVGDRSIYELVDMLLENLDELKEAEQRGLDYMGKYKTGMTPRQIAYMLTGYYQKNDTMGAIKTLRPYIDGFVRTNDQTIVKYDTELYFMQAVSELVLQEYEESERDFKFILDEFPGSHQEANCTYWYAMSQLFLQKYAEAFPNFERYINKFPAETYVDECYFQGGICLFGQEKYKEALKRFSYVIDTFPDSSVFPEACSMRGDINGSEGLLDEAIVDYRMAIAAAKKPVQATYAVFQMAEVYEAEDKYDEIIAVVESYLDVWQAEAEISKALFWIGKTKIQQKLYDEAVSTYVDTIVKYGGDLREDGVDLMIAELVKISQIYLNVELQISLSDKLEAAMDAADNKTLKLRLRVTLAQLNQTEFELGKELITELENLDNASPPVLATICDASFEMKNYSRADEMLRIFINKFEDSEYMRAAYKLRGFGQYSDKDYEGTLATINDAQALYGTDFNVAWAQLLKAKVFLDTDDIENARKENMSILTVPSWRGEPVAQATYQLGEVEEAAGNLAKAFAFYQRTYFQYKGHAGGYWAAEGYLASARILDKMERMNDKRNTYRAMLFDPYVNSLPQAVRAREVLGATEVAEIQAMIDAGTTTNISITVEAEMTGGAVKSSETVLEELSATPAETSVTEEGE